MRWINKKWLKNPKKIYYIFSSNLTTGIQSTKDKSNPWLIKYENVPKTNNEIAAPNEEIANKIRRPTLSINIDDA